MPLAIRLNAVHLSGTVALKYNRVLLKLSGESFAGGERVGIDLSMVASIAADIQAATNESCQIAVTIGGGNLVRGADAAESGMDRASADYAGMLATSINGLFLLDALEKLGLEARLMSAIKMEAVAEPFIRRRALRHMEKGRVVILTGGTGNPFFTSDTAAALRAAELHCQAILKATNVDGVYDKDPKKHRDAIKYDRLKFGEAIRLQLGVMDLTAFTLSMENNIPIVVFNSFEKMNLLRVLRGEQIGTIVGG